ncbi:hypothetical protein H9I45_06200 [Polaribacter haliotis]|uniref:Uncharacterized protein n=1 Tax=Polaribacter haliotis TaxID=1888915 RepID=A0A7L8AJ84_9FLAO|nr:hypothetical protein [Polaribacter haliotis]QOD62033.1 hypothetical protein H9I45_06200 [Polaribacter haliotis]
MKTKNIKVTEKLNNAIVNAKSSAKKANDYALNTTEEVVLETITIAENWQKVTDKALKGGVKLMANQQNLIFDTLETVKAQLIDGKKKLSKVFA